MDSHGEGHSTKEAHVTFPSGEILGTPPREFVDVVDLVMLHRSETHDGWRDFAACIALLSREHIPHTTMDGLYLLAEALADHVLELSGSERSFSQPAGVVRGATNRVAEFRICWHEVMGSAHSYLAGFINLVITWHATSNVEFPVDQRGRRMARPKRLAAFDYYADSSIDWRIRLRALVQMMDATQVAIQLSFLNDHMGLDTGDDVVDSTATGEMIASLANTLIKRPETLAYVSDSTIVAGLERVRHLEERLARGVDERVRVDLAVPDDRALRVVAPSHVAGIACFRALAHAVLYARGDSSQLSLTKEALSECVDILTIHRPRSKAGGQVLADRIESFVVPPGDSAQWPCSIPEAEEVFRFIACRQLLLFGRLSLTAGTAGVYLVADDDDCIVVVLIPTASWMARLPDDTMLEFAHVPRKEALIWALYPSRADGSWVEASFGPLRLACSAVREVIASEALATNIQTARRTAIDIATLGSATAITSAFLSATQPAAENFVATAGSAVLIDLARMCARRAFSKK